MLRPEGMECLVRRVKVNPGWCGSTLPDDPKGTGPVQAMRAGCRQFLTEPHSDFRNFARHAYRPWGRMDMKGARVLRRGRALRATFGVQLAALAFTYEIEVEPELASILSAEEDSPD